MRKVEQIIAGAILVLASTTFFSQAATAHTSVVRTDPTYKTTLTEMSDRITIEFTDSLMVLGDKEVNAITLTAPDGTVIEIKGVSVIQNSITAQLPQGDFLDGTYIVNYRVVSADGHPVSGSYEFYLNAPGTSVATTAVEHDEHNGFFHVHQTHIIWAGIALIFIVLWIGYRRFNREQGE